MISFINLETAITDRKKPANIKKEYNFASNSNTAGELVNSSIDLVNLSNNHALDYDQEGFIDTMNLLTQLVYNTLAEEERLMRQFLQR